MKTFQFRVTRGEIGTDGLKVTPILNQDNAKPRGQGLACKGRVSYHCDKKKHHNCVSLTCGCECHKKEV